jgi:hypothetical protein
MKISNYLKIVMKYFLAVSLFTMKDRRIDLVLSEKRRRGVL